MGSEGSMEYRVIDEAGVLEGLRKRYVILGQRGLDSFDGRDYFKSARA